MSTEFDANSELASHSLELVHRELQATLEHARRNIESFVDDQAGTDSLLAAAELLHLASGALKIVEVHGAALLAEEMELVCRFLCEELDAETKAKGTEAITRAMVQLPAYLERLLSGGRDIALVLLPLLNDLRALRGRPLMSEGTLLLLRTGPLERPPRAEEPPPDPDVSAQEFTLLAQQQRPGFQSALLGWIRGAQTDANLDSLIVITSTIEQAASTRWVQQLWGVMCGVFVALRDGGLESSVALKRLIGQADRQLKRLADEGEDAFRRAPPNDLLNNLLYYVARAESEDERIRAIRSDFNLNQLIPGDDQLERAREGLSGPSVKLMRTVAEAIKQDLGAVKDNLDIFVRTGMQDLRQLLPQLEMLQKIGDTLGVLGLDAARSQIREQMSELNAMVDASSDVDQQILESVAAVLLHVEDELDRELVRAVIPDGEAGRDVSQNGASQYREVTQAVMGECIVNLAKVKEAVVRLVDSPSDTRALEQVRPQLRGIAAGLLMLNKTTVVRLIERIGAVLFEGLTGEDGLVDAQRVERVADAIVSVEYYMETVSAGRKDPWYMLENAARCLELLERTATAPPDGTAELPIASDIALSEYSETESSPAEIAAQTDAEVAATGSMSVAEFVAAEAGHTIPQAPGTSTGTTGVMAALESDQPHTDPELIEIFIDEAKGEVEAITTIMPKWIADPTNLDALIETRRSFHTLKGSGRTVGATVIGDFAWSIENLFNRVINRTIEPLPAICAVAQEAANALPVLLDQLELGIVPKIDIKAIESRAAALANGEAIDEPAAMIESAEDIATPRIDPVLAEIFIKETRGHLNTINNFIEKAVGLPPPYQIDESLYRATHTLLGSANMANYEPCVSVADPLSAWLSHRYQNQLTLDEAELSLLQDATVEIATVADALAQQRYVTPNDAVVAQLTARVGAASSALSLSQKTSPTPTLTSQADEPLEITPPLESVQADEKDFADHELSEDIGSTIIEELAIIDEIVMEGDAVSADQAPENSVEFDPEIAAIFTEEAAELLDQAESVQQDIRSGALPSAEGLGELQRLLHTLKGGARLAGIRAMGDLSHTLESVLAQMAKGNLATDAVAMTLVQRSFDQLQLMRDCVDSGRPIADGMALIGDLQRFADGTGVVAQHTAPVETAASPSNDLRERIIAETINQPLDFDLTGIGFEGVAPMPDASSSIERTGSIEFSDEQLAHLQDIAFSDATQPQPQPPPTSPEDSRLVAADETAPEPNAAPAPVSVAPEPPAPVSEAEAESATTAMSAHEQVPADAPVAATVPGAAQEAQRSVDRAETARVDAQVLDSLLNAAGEISIFQARLNQQVRSVDFHLGELGQTVTRLREQLRKLEAETEAEILYRHQDDTVQGDFDPLELDRYSTIQQLSRALSETANDVASINELLMGLTTEADTLLTQQGRVTADIQDGLMQTRMVPFQRHVTRFSRIVRQTAAETGRQAELVVVGANSELDRQVLDSMLPALEHLVRNSVVHGIEPPEKRQAAGKPAAGTITMTLSREGAEVSIDVADDGDGLNLEAIAHTAAERGLIPEGQAVSEKQAAELILVPGFSTAGQLTQSAGRGVGMDVVDNELKKLGGSMTIETTRGNGTHFHIRLPYTLAITHALVVDVGDETFALPLTTVEGITRVKREQLLELLTDDDPRLDYGETSYKLQHLGSLVGSSPSALPQDDSAVALVLVRAGENSTALLTDRLEGSREVVVKSLGPHIGSVPGVTGATILGDGRVIVILDAGTLIRQQPSRAAVEKQPQQQIVDSTITALVVDDSITMRRVTERLLERRGVRVVTARDGLDAITALQDHEPDIILLDIEMPRMDGYQFAAHVRNDDRFRDLPIIMITSRSGEKHRAKAIELGVNDYLSKPYQEQNLVAAIEGQLGRSL